MRFFENKTLSLNKSHLRFIYMIIDESKRTFDLPYSDPDLKKMLLLPRPTLGGQQLIKNLLEILLVNVMRDETDKANSDTVFLTEDEYEGHVANLIITYLKEHLRDKVRVEDICKKLSYNKSYLFRQFKQATGRSIMSYFMELKVNLAKKLLKDTAKSVSQIGLELSFDTPNYFTKCFKKIVGCTPLEYRKSHRIRPR